MSNFDSDGRPVVETVRYPSGTEVSSAPVRQSRTGYWVAGLVAVVAIIAVAVMVVNHNNTQAALNANATQSDAASAAFQQGAAQATVNDATIAAQNAAAQASVAASNATAAANTALSQAAVRAQQANQPSDAGQTSNQSSSNAAPDAQGQ